MDKIELQEVPRPAPPLPPLSEAGVQRAVLRVLRRERLLVRLKVAAFSSAT